MLEFLEKLTLAPEEVGAADVAALRHAGLSDRAIEDAVHVCAIFNLYDRLADSFAFHVPDARAFAVSAKMLLRFGYD